MENVAAKHLAETLRSAREDEFVSLNVQIEAAPCSQQVIDAVGIGGCSVAAREQELAACKETDGHTLRSDVGEEPFCVTSAHLLSRGFDERPLQTTQLHVWIRLAYHLLRSGAQSVEQDHFLWSQDFVAQFGGREVGIGEVEAEYGCSIQQTIVPAEEGRMLLCIMRDVSEEEDARRQREEISRQTVEVADKVVDKQMRIVQEIASLLGETAAETKIALSKLKESITNE